MTSIILSPQERARIEHEALFSKTRCHICKFPSGKIYNRKTGEKRVVFFYKAPRGKYVCNYCVASGKGIRVAKYSRAERKVMKRAKKSWLGIHK